MQPSTNPEFTVILAINRSPELLPFAIRSVLGQSLSSFELFIVCDGAPDKTLKVAKDFEKRDLRIRTFVFDKGERHGEAHRHTALENARGQYVAHIADDDLWLPEHLQSLKRLLQHCDFGNTLHFFLNPDGGAGIHYGDLSDAATRKKLLDEKFNFFGPSVAGYRLGAYRKLPEGWAPAPADIWTDLWMWRKFLRQPNLKFATAFQITAVTFADSIRGDMSIKRRRAEISSVFAKLGKMDAIYRYGDD